MCVFRSQRGTAVQPTVVLVRFVAWPLVMEEQSSGPLEVQKAPPDERCTRHPPQEPSRRVSTHTPSLHPVLQQSNLHISLTITWSRSNLTVQCLWSQVLSLLQCRALLTVWRNTDKLWTPGKMTDSGMPYFHYELYTYKLTMHCWWQDVAGKSWLICQFFVIIWDQIWFFCPPIKAFINNIPFYLYIFVVKNP